MRAAALAAGLLATLAAAAPPPVISWQDASAHVGEIVTVDGDVVSATASGDTVTLEFAREPGAFRVVFLVPMLNDLPPNPGRLWNGRRVRASGRIDRFRGRSEMVLHSSSQIEVVDVAAVASAPSTTVPPPTAPAMRAPPPPPPAAAVIPSPPPETPPVAPPPVPVARSAAPSTTLPPPPAAVAPPPSPPPTVAAAPAPPPTIAAAPPAPPPTPPRDLAEAVQRRVGALGGCERARARWRDASSAARAGAETLTRCLDAGTYDCRTAAAALAPALSSLEGAAQQVERACPP